MEGKVLTPEETNKDIIYHYTYVLLIKLAPYIPRRITPNQLTIAGSISSLIACALLYFIQSPVCYLYWMLFNFGWFILDALDGIHARYTGQTSEYGAFLDHFLDNFYFIFMFTVFTIKFDLAYPIYVCAIIVRITAALSVFVVQFHTRKLYLSRFSGGLELILLNTAMLLSYFFPDFNPSLHTNNTFLLHIINALYLQQGVFMKLTLLVYLIGVPVNFLMQVRFVKKHTNFSN